VGDQWPQMVHHRGKRSGICNCLRHNGSKSTPTSPREHVRCPNRHTGLPVRSRGSRHG
jgi:hypothetical protein